MFRFGQVEYNRNAKNGSSRFTLVQLGFVGFGSIRFCNEKNGSSRSNSIQLGLVGFGSIRFGSIRWDSDPFGSILFDSVRFRCSSVRFEFDLFGQAQQKKDPNKNELLNKRNSLP